MKRNVKIFDGMRHSVTLLLAVLMMTVTGCDFMRVLAGRPTSKDIENKRLEIIKAEEAALQAKLDSIRLQEEKRVADSLAAMQALVSAGVVLSGPERLGGLVAESLPSKYHVVAGAFKDGKNAQKLADEASAKGYKVALLECRRGMIAVGLCPSDNIAEVASSYDALKNETFFPKDAWVLVME